MAWPPRAQRVLIAAAAVLAAYALWAARREAATPLVVSVPDDPSLEVRLDLNAASAADLETLPGVGKALAARIVARREARGPFRSGAELAGVPGVGEALAARLAPLVTAHAPDGAGAAPPPSTPQGPGSAPPSGGRQ